MSPIQFGKKKKDMQDQGSGNYLRNFAKGETLVRFLDEQEEWIGYREHYTLDGKSFPCTEENKETCPGCTHSNEKVSKSARKYGAEVYLVKTEKVLPFRIPISLSDSLARRAERNEGTLLSRDYVILRSGAGMDTRYDVDQEDKYPVDLSDLRKKVTIEVGTCLSDSFAEVWGADWSPEVAHATKPRSAKPKKEEDPPSEPATKGDPGSQGGDDLTEAQVRGMTKPQLALLCDRAGVKYTDDDTRSELADRLIDTFGT